MSELNLGGWASWCALSLCLVGVCLVGVACAGHPAPSAPVPAAETQNRVASAAVGAADASRGGEEQEPAAPSDPREPSEQGTGDQVPLKYRVQPPDGQWLVDEEGRQYFLDPVPKVEGQYRWIDEAKGIVRLRHLPPQLVERHDDSHFYIRFYRIEPPEPTAAEPTPDVAEIDAQYQSTIATRDDWRLVPFDTGLPQQGQWRNAFDLADMNGDGRLDIVHGPVRKGTRVPSVFLNQGQGRWLPWQPLEFPPGPYDYGDIEVADFNGDGHHDLALAMHLTGLRVLVGDGQGRFEDWGAGLPLKRGKDVERGAGRSEEEEHAAVFSSRELAVVDWNRDDRPDLLVFSEGPTGIPEAMEVAESAGEQSGTAVGARHGKRLFINNGDGSWDVVLPPIEDHMIGDQVVLIDLDRDGRLDFVTDSRSYGVDDLLNYAREETWTTLKVPNARPGMVVQSVSTADFDGDGWVDLAIAFSSRETDTHRFGVDLYYGGEPGDDGLQPWRRESLFATADRYAPPFFRLAAGDLEGDGDEDLVAMRRNGEAWLLVNDGRGGFEREVAPELDQDGRHYYCTGWHLELEDLDGEAGPELVIAYAGEPGSEQLLAGTEAGRPRCRAEGALRVFRIEPSDSAKTASRAR